MEFNNFSLFHLFMFSIFKNWKEDLPASFVVFFVALPLCLGVAYASTGDETKLFTGIIAGAIGGIVVGAISNSRLGVSGPAAGLITIVLSAISTLGSYEAFLTAVVIAGILQVIAGSLGFGILSNFFASSVIKGMLAAIGITLILKEVPHAVGYDADFMGDESFLQSDGHNTFSEILFAISKFSPGAIIISLLSLVILLLFELDKFKNLKFTKIIPSALIVVVVGILSNQLFYVLDSPFYLKSQHLVQLPSISSLGAISTLFYFPDFSMLLSLDVYKVAVVIFIVASLESLLSVEATDKMDTKKKRTNGSRELIAQGVGNTLSGLIGGLPVTQVIVRSSANISAGAESKLSAILHGVILIVCAVLIPSILNLIPLASLATILILVGYKLSKLGLYKRMFLLGMEQFLPFVVTIISVLLTDLLKGIAIGMAVAIFFILRKKFRNKCRVEKTFDISENKDKYIIRLSEEVSFLNKANIAKTLKKIPDDSLLVIDGSNTQELDYDILELINEYIFFTAPNKNIEVKRIRIKKIIPSNSH